MPKLTENEIRIISEVKRKANVEHGRIPCVLIIQDNKIVKVDFEKVTESVR